MAVWQVWCFVTTDRHRFLMYPSVTTDALDGVTPISLANFSHFLGQPSRNRNSHHLLCFDISFGSETSLEFGSHFTDAHRPIEACRFRLRKPGAGAWTLFGRAGSFKSWAPEVYALSSGYNAGYGGKSADIWSGGICSHELICGRYPFRGRTPRETRQGITTNQMKNKILAGPDPADRPDPADPDLNGSRFRGILE